MVQVNSVDEYLQFLRKYKDFPNVFYRGQSRKYETITCSVSRDENYWKNENRIFQTVLDANREEYKNLKSSLEYLAKMQHYGIKTRLVDFTTDPKVALFFAVQESDKTEHDCSVYVYIQEPLPQNHKHIRLLALLATLDSFGINRVREAYHSLYHEHILEREVLDYASTSAFIEKPETLLADNERMGEQHGTFAICGNVMQDKQISKELQPLTTIPPTVVIRIPFEHTQAIKNELDIKYNLNESSVYPELPAFGSYIMEKFMGRTLDLSDSYQIGEIEDISIANAKRMSIKTFLKKRLPEDGIKQVATEIIKQHKAQNDVIFIYIAKTEDSLIVNNWILRGQWIRETLDSRFWPRLIGERDQEGIILRFEDSYSVLEDYHEEYTFEDDKLLFIKNMKTFEKLEFHFMNIRKVIRRNDYIALKTYALENASPIAQLYLQFVHFERSKNQGLNQFLDNFQEFALHVDDIVAVHKRDNIKDAHALRQLVFESFQLASSYYKIITKQRKSWQKSINLSDREYNETNLSLIKKKEYKFRPTMPINPNGLNVTFNLDITTNQDNTLDIKGTTNLYDSAHLLLTISDSTDSPIAQSKSKVENGNFNFGRLGKEGVGLQKGEYQIEITLSVPSQQDKTFISKAGTEYENLSGPFIDRGWISPTGSYTEKYKI